MTSNLITEPTLSRQDCQHAMSSKSSNKLHIDITIDFGVAQVKPACVDVLRPFLEYQEVVFQRVGGRLRHERRTQPAYTLKSDDRLIVAAGCVRRVRRELERLGHTVTGRAHLFFGFDGSFEKRAVGVEKWPSRAISASVGSPETIVVGATGSCS